MADTDARRRQKQRRRIDADYRTEFFPYRHREGDEPFVVAFERGGGFAAGDRVSRDGFEDLLDDYDAVIVHHNRGDHPSREDHFILYGEARQALDADDHIETVERRERGVEITGEFRWFSHGRGLAVDTTVGMHCTDEAVFDDLP